MGKKILKTEVGIDVDYDGIKKVGGAGYANMYVLRKWNRSSLENEAGLDVYKILFEIDYLLGTKSEHQLYMCCAFSVNLDFIEVITDKY